MCANHWECIYIYTHIYTYVYIHICIYILGWQKSLLILVFCKLLWKNPNEHFGQPYTYIFMDTYVCVYIYVQWININVYMLMCMYRWSIKIKCLLTFNMTFEGGHFYLILQIHKILKLRFKFELFYGYKFFLLFQP